MNRLTLLILASLICVAGLSLLAQVSASGSSNLPLGVNVIEARGVHNFFALGTNVYSGSSPESEEGFAALAKLGIKTIISVDGARPDVDAAKRHGLRYVHLPHGYDGIDTNSQARLVKAAETFSGPFFVHCHHGKHRGPTAAAVICLAKDGWSPRQAEAWLTLAGTATNYTGLFETVRHFHTPSAATLKSIPTDFPEAAKVSGLMDAMVEIDERWEHLKAVRAAGFQTPKDHPDLKPANEVVILWEHFREAQRLSESAHFGAEFVERLRTSEADVREAEKLLRQFAANGSAEVRLQLERRFDAISQSCSACHKTHRDRPVATPGERETPRGRSNRN